METFVLIREQQLDTKVLHFSIHLLSLSLFIQSMLGLSYGQFA